jgi:hypothetical protein
VRVLKIIETGERVVSETRGSSVNEVGALGVLKDLLEGAFHCVCRRDSEDVGDREMCGREEGRLINETKIKG